jgi:hypothetical protein
MKELMNNREKLYKTMKTSVSTPGLQLGFVFSTPHVAESDAGGSLSSWQSHPSR